VPCVCLVLHALSGDQQVNSVVVLDVANTPTAWRRPGSGVLSITESGQTAPL